ncbi:hypothetical protein LCGC14_1260590 [marine sediment metagenome]|uniref:Outer membrane protein beta-barrel domain-containing protein n=1 Tax=marine sediment metagenome TaxID=412755 RepID=A0A0F9P447_9ZZZZ|nr:hypothetical protein [Candidatus Aminicenantes bacterium]
MKKLLAIIAATIFLSGLASAFNISVELKGSWLQSSERAFEDIYGDELIMMYGAEISIGIFGPLEAWFEGSYSLKKGKLSFTQEETKLKIIPTGAGLKFRFPVEEIDFYVGVGLNYYAYEESNPLGEVKKYGLGYIGKIGASKKIMGGLMIGFYLDYSYCKLKPADFGVNIGGFHIGWRLGYEF